MSRKYNLEFIARNTSKSPNAENIYLNVIRDKYLPLSTDTVMKVQLNTPSTGIDIWFQNAGHRAIMM